MGKAMFEPKWWTLKHGTQWANLKEALERDWEQTKKDLHVGGHELHQTVKGTLDQAAGAAPIPPKQYFTWDEAEEPLRYGVAAREQFAAQHAGWNDSLETTLKTDWEGADGGALKRKWDEVKHVVRHGYDRGARN